MIFFFRQRNASKQCGQITVLFKSFAARSLFAVTSHMMLKQIVLQLKQIVWSVAYLEVLGTSANWFEDPQVEDSRVWFADLRTNFLPQIFAYLR